MLFEIDPADYEQALEKAKSSLASLDEQIDVGRAQDEQLKFGIKAAEAGVQSETAQLKHGGYVAPARAAAAKAFRNGGTSGRGANEGCGSRTGSSRKRAKT